MSSILKALKRLEQQKMVRKHADHDIAWIVHGEDYRPEKKRQWPMIVSLVGVAVLAVLSTYWFMGGYQGAPRAPLSRPGGEVRSSSGSPAAAEPAPSQPSRPETPPVSIHESAMAPPAVVNGPAENSLRNSTATVSLKGDRESSKGQAFAPPAVLPPRPEPTPAPQTTKPSLPILNVTGIAWEKDSPVRLAIVNGTSVEEGSMIAGVKVEKILPDRVRFTFENRSFDVLLERGAASN